MVLESGYTERTVNVPDNGLYYMWIYLSGDDVRNLYGYILVDNLQPEIALDSISLPKTMNIELGKTLTLKPTFSPVNTTNKIVIWTSSDESVATVDNAGKVTPKKIGSTIITVTSQDGKKRATCTVTVIEKSKDNEDGNNNSGSDNKGNTNGSGTTNNNGSTNTSGNTNNSGTSNNGGTTNTGSSNSKDNKKDNTMATGKLPQTGIGIGFIFIIVASISGAIFTYIKYNKLKGI